MRGGEARPAGPGDGDLLPLRDDGLRGGVRADRSPSTTAAAERGRREPAAGDGRGGDRRTPAHSFGGKIRESRSGGAPGSERTSGLIHD
uniref:Uncharacterized protein n=1 Tax=Oryza barthii TaxID=65489 RepID=A0A0D3FYV9_9ORYZ